MARASRPQRTSRRREKQPDAGTGPIQQLPRKQPRRYFKPLELISADQLEQIHEASLRVLEELGIELLNAEGREILQKAGAIVEGQQVRIGRDIVEAGLATVSIAVVLGLIASWLTVDHYLRDLGPG